MSDAEEPKEEPKEEHKASQTDVSEHLQTFSLDRIPKKNSEGITINFYSSSYTPKSDKPVQTEPSSTELVPKLSKASDAKTKKLGSLASESREIRSYEYTTVSHKNSTGIPHAIRTNKLMNSRKFSDSKPTGRTATDLERKKLEAELKATEEIAKIQQTVIEKRLALELASLQDGNDYPHKIVSPQHSAPHSDSRVVEEITRKQNLKENNLAEQLDSLDYQTRTQPPRPPPPTRALANDSGKICNLKTDSNFLSQTSSDLNPLRQLIEKKINLDRRSSRTSEMKYYPSQTNSSSQDPRYAVYPEAQFARKSTKSPVYPPPDQPGCSPQAMRNYKNRSLWKSAVIKIKKKLKPVPKPPEV